MLTMQIRKTSVKVVNNFSKIFSWDVMKPPRALAALLALSSITHLKS